MLSKLVELNIDENPLLELPSDFGEHMTSLETLDLGLSLISANLQTYNNNKRNKLMPPLELKIWIESTLLFCMLILTLPFASLLVIRSHRTMITQTRFVSSANGLVQKRMRKSNPPLSHIVFLKMNIKERPIPSFLLVSFSFTC